jgi:hypothetical protein
MLDVLPGTCHGRHQDECRGHGQQDETHGARDKERRRFRHHPDCPYSNAALAARATPRLTSGSRGDSSRNGEVFKDLRHRFGQVTV